jgi:hypothetical protein
MNDMTEALGRGWVSLPAFLLLCVAGTLSGVEHRHLEPVKSFIALGSFVLTA